MSSKDYNMNKAFLFGDDANPCCVEINFQNLSMKYKGAPIGLKLLGF